MNTDALNELKEYKIKLFTKINFLLEDLLSVSNERVKKATNDLIYELKMELENVDKKIDALTSGNNDDGENEKYENDTEDEDDDNDEDDTEDEDDDNDNDEDDTEDEDDDNDEDDTEDEDDDNDEDDTNQDNSSSSSGGQSVYVGRKDNGDVVAIFNEK